MNTVLSDDYWTEETFLFHGTFRYYHGEPRQVRALIHTSKEAYDNRWDGNTQIIPIPTLRGKRIYVMIHPYVLEPRVLLTVGLYDHPTSDKALGHVISSEVSADHPVQAHKCGSMQGWYYHENHIFALWECFLDRYVRDVPLEADTNMLALWQSIEGWLLQKYPQTRQIMTPFRDPLFPNEQYQNFLARQGYSPVAQAAWVKHIHPENVEPHT